MTWMTKYQRDKTMERLKSQFPIDSIWNIRAIQPLKMPIVDLVKVIDYHLDSTRVVAVNQQGHKYWLSEWDFRRRSDEPFICNCPSDHRNGAE